MALITTVAGTTSNAYISLSEAEDLQYILKHSDQKKWAAASEECRSDAIKAATVLLDTLNWDGVRSTKAGTIPDPTILEVVSNRDKSEFRTDSQALEVPRDFMVNELGVYLIPLNVKLACLVQASTIVNEGGTSGAQDAVNAGIKRFKIEDGVELEFDGKNKSKTVGRAVVDQAFKLIKDWTRAPRFIK